MINNYSILKINSLTIILLLVMLYPFMYMIPYINNLGFKYENIHMSFVLLPLILFNYRKMISVSLLKISTLQLISIGSLFLLILININSIKYFKSLYFIGFMALMYIMTLNWKSFVLSNKLIKLIILFFFTTSLLYIINRPIGARFEGYIPSPTVFSVFVNSFFLIGLFVYKKTCIKIILYILAFYLTAISETRLNLLFITVTPLILWVIKKQYFSKKTIFVLFNIFFVSVYPIYSVLIKTEFVQSILKVRYDGSTVDSSFNSRSGFNDVGRESLFDGSILQILFGKGAGFTRTLMIEHYNEPLLMHNDYLRLSLDYGVIFTIIFLVFLYNVSKNNNLAFLTVLLYLLTFYHNMVYSLYFISIIIIFSIFKFGKLNIQFPNKLV